MMSVDRPACAELRRPQWLYIACSAALLGTTILSTRPALAQSACLLDGTVLSCSGDLSDGVSTDSPEVRISDLTQDIRPDAGVAGVLVQSDSSATLSSDTGAHAIRTENASGIAVLATGGDAEVAHQGDITAQNGIGISLRADNGAVRLEGAGALEAGLSGIVLDARSGDSQLIWDGSVQSETGHAILVTADQGGVLVQGSGQLSTDAAEGVVYLHARGPEDEARFDWSGDLLAAAGRGIVAASDNGAVTVLGTGQIDTALGAVQVTARGWEGDASFRWSGALSAASGTVVVLEAMNGGVLAEGSGAVQGQSGFTLDARGWGSAASLTWDGDITATAGHGVWASSANGAASVSGSGTVLASDIGLFVGSTGSADASLDWEGDLTSSGSFAARVATANGAGSILGRGTIVGYETGLSVAALGGTATVTWQGNISSADGYGIGATSNSSAVTVSGSGRVQGKLPAIYARTTSGATARVDWTGDLTSSHGSALEVSSATGAAEAEGRGTVLGARVGILATSEGWGDASVLWTGNITGGQQAVYVSSALGGASLQGRGALTGGSDAVHLESLGSGAVTLDWRGDISAAGNNGVYIASALGAVLSETRGAIEAAGGGIHAWSGTGDAGTSVTIRHSGDLEAGGTGLQATTGGGAVSVSFDGRLTAGEFGIYADGRGYGATSVSATGALTSGGTGIHAYSFGADVSVIQTGQIQAGGLGIVAQSDSDGSVFIDKTGSLTAASDAIRAHSSGADAIVVVRGGQILSTGGMGIAASSDYAAASVSGTGWVRGGTRGISVASTGYGAADIIWQGDVTGGSEALHAYSAHGSVSILGRGTVLGGTDAISLRSEGGAQAVLEWRGDITSTGQNGIVVSTAAGSAASKTKGAISSAGGGIYALSETGESSDRVTVAHLGRIQAGGIGIEAKTSAGAVAVALGGDLTTGSYGIYAESLGAETVSVEQAGTILAGHDAIRAYSATGDVSVHQAGAISAYSTGIRAFNEGDGTIFVGTRGDILAGGDGIIARSALGDITVRMSGGDLVSTAGTGIFAANSADDTVIAVEMTGNLTAALDGIIARSANGEVYASSIGRLSAGGTGIRVLSEGSGEVGITHRGDLIAGGDGMAAGSASGNATTSLLAGTISAGGNGMRVTGYGNLAANVAAGAVVIGGEGAAGILFENGLESTLTNYGTIRNAGGYEDYAVLAEHHYTLVQNFGTISGNVLLGGWGGDFNNNIGAVLNTGTLFGGTEAELVTAGKLSPGGDLAILTTVVEGRLRATGTSRLAFDLDMEEQRSDRIEVTGTAALGGTLALAYTSVTSGALSFDLLTAEGGLAADDLRLGESAFIRAELARLEDGKTLRVTVSDLDLAPEGLTSRSHKIGGYLNRAFAAGDDGASTLAALIASAGSLGAGEEIFQNLTPIATLDAASASQVQAIGFSDALMSCPVPSGLSAPLREGACDWMRVDHSGSSRKSIGGRSSTSSSYMLSYGMQRALGDSDWRFGAAAGYAVASTRIEGGSRTASDRINLGVSVKYAPGPYQFSAALTGSWGDLKTTRRVVLGDRVETITGDTALETYSLKLRAAYLLGQDSLYLIPQVDLNTTFVMADAYEETGGLSALAFERASSTVVTLSPALEIGRAWRYEDGGVLRAFARIGTSLASQGGVAMTARLATDSTGVEGFTVKANRDQQLWTLGAGLSAFAVKGWTGEAKLNLNFGGATTEHQASLKLRKSF